MTNYLVINMDGLSDDYFIINNSLLMYKANLWTGRPAFN